MSRAKQRGVAMALETAPSPYLSPKELARRWRCGRSTVDRIAERERLTRLCLGEGRNGVIRYLLEEVETLERDRLLRG